MTPSAQNTWVVIGMNERKLRKLDSLFAFPGQPASALPAQRRLAVIPHGQIDPHPKHPFRPYDSQSNPSLLESIRTLGVLQPVLLQAKPDGRYTLLAGYKRLWCNKEVGNQEILALVDEQIPDAAAELIITQTNSTQCGLKDFLPSELAYALKMELDALTELRRQLKNHGEASGEIRLGNKVFQMAHLEKSRDSLAKAYRLTPTAAQRYLQLTSLLPELLELVDRKELPLRAAVPLSTLPAETQKTVFFFIQKGISISTEKALALKREWEKAGFLSLEQIQSFLSRQVDAKRPSVSLRSQLLARYFPRGQSKEEIQATIEKALELYFSLSRD